ncbi:uncharacterized protein [Aegilops tauschii subsp. strangulata]|uniref:uncharacterized protein n=1 Tax=Aegilops tauschii subsp. strangulata TaxID=200361 RepID=UPI001ABC14CA
MVLAVVVGADGSHVLVSWNDRSCCWTRVGLVESVSAADLEVVFGSIGRIAGIEFVRTSGPSFSYVGFHCPSHKVMTKLFSTENLQKSWFMLYRETGDETRSLSHMEQRRELKPCGVRLASRDSCWNFTYDAYAGCLGVMESVPNAEFKAENSAMIPEFWLTECGQSATSALLDYIAQNHIAAPLLANQAASENFHGNW